MVVRDKGERVVEGNKVSSLVNWVGIDATNVNRGGFRRINTFGCGKEMLSLVLYMWN